MSIQSEIDRISGNIADSYSAAAALGAEMPQNENSDSLPDTIAQISLPYNVNLLDNADWYAYAINQRGDTAYTLTDAYGVDRWRTTGNITITAPTASAVGYITMSSGCVMKQRMEILPSSLIGKTVTAAIDIGGTVYSGSAEFPESGEETVFTGGGVTVTVGLDSGTYEICDVSAAAVPYIKITSSAAVNVNRVWLELGSACHMETTAPRNYADMLVRCMRYYYETASYVAWVGYRSTSSYAFIDIPNNMRVAPTVNGSGFAVRGAVDDEGSTNAATVTSVSLYALNKIRLTLTTEKPLTNNQPLVFIASKLTATADL